MVDKTATACELAAYVCPACKDALEQNPQGLLCRRCAQTYAIVDGLPDFVREDLARNRDPMWRNIGAMDRFARFYESGFWYQGVLNLMGGFKSTTLERLIAEISAMVAGVQGRILDVACGPGTYGRRVASASKEVFGIDISLNMLRQGVIYTRRDHIESMHFARARVESLPFADRFFDAALCCGSLHLFPDTVVALREIARTLKPGARLAAMTFTPGRRGLLRYQTIRERLRRKYGTHVFDVEEMHRYLTAAGFDNYRPQALGSVLIFSATRSAA
jgi:ubiquinone/menaquinone biosynthesis C-methylase UbiE/uncharacterized protein YbaR (Trm112 family)